MSWCTGHSFHYFDAGRTAHLYAIIAHDGDPPENCLAVNITTIRDGPYDESCVLEPNCHKCIPHRSSVVYRLAKIWKASVLEDKRRNGEIFQDKKDIFHWKVLNQMQQGGLRSDKMSPDNKEFLRKYLNS